MVLWALSVGSALLTFVVPVQPTVCADSPPLLLQLLPLPFFVILACFARRSPFLVAPIATLITRHTGAPSYETFLVMLKPILMFSVAGLVTAIGLSWQCRESSANNPSLFLFSGAVAFLLMHVILKYRKVPGV